MALELIEKLQGHTERVWNVKWHSNGKLFASCASDKTIRIWLKQGQFYYHIFHVYFSLLLLLTEDGHYKCESVLSDGHERTIRGVAWSPCGQYLASVSFDATTCIWEFKEGSWECLVTLEGHENEVKCATWSSSGKYLATCSRDKTVWIWEYISPDEYECASVQTAHTQDVKKVAWHPQKDILFSCGYDNTIRIYKDEGDDWECFQTLTSHESTVWSISFNLEGDKMVSCSDDKTIRVWQSDASFLNWKCVCTLSGYHERPIYDVSWCKYNDYIVTAAGDNDICVFKPDCDNLTEKDSNLLNFSLVTKHENAHETDVNGVDWNPKEKDVFISCGDDKIIRIWKVKEEN